MRKSARICAILLTAGAALALVLGVMPILPKAASPIEAVAGETSQTSENTATSFTVEKPFTHYYDESAAMTTTVSSGGTPSAAYWTPFYDSERTGAGLNGGTNAGVLTVKSSSGIESRGYYNPSSSFDYNSFEVGGDVSFEFAFHKVASCSLPRYGVANCGTTSLYGYSLGQSIGVGTMMILKRGKRDSGWTKIKGAEYHNLVNGAVCKYTPDASDVFEGTYYMFVSAYQYYVYDHSASAFFISVDHYVFHAVLQTVTVFVARGGTTLKFATDTTPIATYQMPTSVYEPYLGSETVRLNSSTYRRSNSLGVAYPLAKYSITGELLYAGTDNNEIQSDLPLYFYNGVSDQIVIERSDYSSAYSKYATTDSAATTISSLHVNASKETEAISTLPTTIGSALFMLEGLTYDDGGNPIWTMAGSKSGNKITLHGLEFGAYEFFRVVTIKPVIYNGSAIAETAVSYFKIEIDVSKFRNSYAVEGSKSEVYAGALSSTLGDGSICLSSFSVSNNPAYEVLYSYNGSAYSSIDWTTVDGMQVRTFRQAGKYRFKVTNDFLETSFTTIYVLGAKSDLAKSTFFGTYNGLVDPSKRVYAPESRVPCYGVGASFRINGGQFLPGLYGSISRILSDGTVDVLQRFEDLHSTMQGKFSEPGNYVAEIQVGDPTSQGDRIVYSYYFSIVESSAYLPRVNYEMLRSGIFTSSFMSKVYMVDIQSKGTGAFRFAFPYTDNGKVEAVDFALEIEALNYKALDDGTYLYDSAIYDSKFALFAAMKENAKARVKVDFLDPNAFLTEGNYHIENVLEQEIATDVYVVSDESIFAELIVEPLYINGFIFTQVAEFESNGVVMISESGTEYWIPYGVEVDTILEESGRYTVYEYNWCGEVEYEVIFLLAGDNRAQIYFNYESEGKIVQEKRDQNHLAEISGDKFYVPEAFDNYDPEDVVTICNGETTQKMLLRELRGKLISGSGRWTVTINNRIGNLFSFDLAFPGDSPSISIYEDLSDPLSYSKAEVIL